MKFGKSLLGGIGGMMLGLGYEAYKSHTAKKVTHEAVRSVMDTEVKNMVKTAFQDEFQDMARDELAKVLADLLKRD